MSDREKEDIFAAAETAAERKKKNNKLRWNSYEADNFIFACHEFQRENAMILVAAALSAAAFAAIYLLFPPFSPEKHSFAVLHYSAIFFLALAEVGFLLAAALALLTNSLLSRFTIICHAGGRERKTLPPLFARGYAQKQGAKMSFIGAALAAIVFVCCRVLTTHVILGSCTIIASGVAIWWLRLYIGFVQKTAFYRSSKKLLPLLEDDAPTAFLEAIPKDRNPQCDEDASLSGLLAIMHLDSSKVRSTASKYLTRIGSAEAVAALVKMLGETEPGIRAQAAVTLGKIGDKSARESIKCLLHDEAVEVRSAAAEALGLLRDESSARALVAALDDSSPEVRGTAADALGNIRMRKAIKALVAKIDDEDWFVRHKVIVALGKMNCELSLDTIAKLSQAAHDSSEFVALAAKHLLEKIYDNTAQEDPLYHELSKTLFVLRKEQKSRSPKKHRQDEEQDEEDIEAIVENKTEILREEIAPRIPPEEGQTAIAHDKPEGATNRPKENPTPRSSLTGESTVVQTPQAVHDNPSSTPSFTGENTIIQPPRQKGHNSPSSTPSFTGENTILQPPRQEEEWQDTGISKQKAKDEESQ